VQVLALPAVRTAPTRKVEAGVLDARDICAREARVALDVAAGLGLDFAADVR
jgi:hypothetical protein